MRSPIEWQLLLLSVFSGLLYIAMLIFKMKFTVSPLIQVLGTLNNYYSAYPKTPFVGNPFSFFFKKIIYYGQFCLHVRL